MKMRGFSIVFGTLTTWFSPEQFPGLTVVNRSVFGFTAIALGDGFLVPSHTTGGVYVMEARPNEGHGVVKHGEKRGKIMGKFTINGGDEKIGKS